jgi:hypothetical protein
MRISDINDPKDPASNQPPAEPDYATQQDYKQVIPVFFDALLKTGAYGKPKNTDEINQFRDSIKYVKEPGRLPLLRTKGINSQQMLTAAKSLGLVEQPLTDEQSASSGQFTIHSFLTPNGVTLTVVLAGRGKVAAAAGASEQLVLTRKDLTPVKLGLAGHYTNRKALMDAAKLAVGNKIKDVQLAEALKGLLDLAYDRGAGQLAPEQLQYIAPIMNMVSQDFGEILAPLALAQDSEDITFPVGNEKLIDVTVGGKTRYSVKALGGSGTSMNSLGNLLDDYELTLTDDGKKQLFQDGIKIWKSTRKEGSVTDRICLAANKNQIPEYLSYVDILGGEFDSFGQLKDLLRPLVKGVSYPDFLKMILPATKAGHWATPVGLPDDSAYYLGQTEKKPIPGQAGKNSYDHDPVDGGANIITYGLGKALYNLIREGPNKEQYKEIMNDMIRQMNCQLGHVNINSNGQLEITSEPFGNLDFEFDYHAPSHIAGNNRPGFMIVPPTKKKKSQTE